MHYNLQQQYYKLWKSDSSNKNMNWQSKDPENNKLGHIAFHKYLSMLLLPCYIYYTCAKDNSTDTSNSLGSLLMK